MQFSSFPLPAKVYSISLKALKQQFSKMADPGDLDVHESNLVPGVKTRNPGNDVSLNHLPQLVLLQEKVEHFSLSDSKSVCRYLD